MEFPEIRIVENPVCVVNEWDVYKILKSINSNKATHSEDYPSWITKCNAELLAEPIADIISSILSTGSFPAIWKQAQVKPLPKTSDPKSCKEYRPISLLYHLSKIVEIFIRKELSIYTPKM